MVHTDRLPFGAYYSEFDDDGPDYEEPQPTISWYFKEEEGGCEDYADQHDVAMTCRCYIDAGVSFTAELQYTEPEED
jgi:hypothetical protein